VKAVTQSKLAASDIRQAAEYYRDEVDPQLAEDFIDTVRQAINHISHWPGSGSTRFSEILDLPGLRAFALARFPYIIFYFEDADHVDVWRVLHASRDIPDILRPHMPN